MTISIPLLTAGYESCPWCGLSDTFSGVTHILRERRKYARAYVDDITIFSQTLQEHMRHLDDVFGLLESLNITFNPAKSYLGYPSVILLGQRVDAFGLTTADEN